MLLRPRQSLRLKSIGVLYEAKARVSLPKDITLYMINRFHDAKNFFEANVRPADKNLLIFYKIPSQQSATQSHSESVQCCLQPYIPYV
jgi:hypothetical protein